MLLESHLLSPPHLPSLPSTPPPLPAPGLRHSALRHYLLAPIPLSLALRPPSLANSRPSHHALPAALRNARGSTCLCTGRGKVISIDSSKETRVSGQNKHFQAHHMEKRNGNHLTWIERDVSFFTVMMGAGEVWRVHLFMAHAQAYTIFSATFSHSWRGRNQLVIKLVAARCRQ